MAGSKEREARWTWTVAVALAVVGLSGCDLRLPSFEDSMPPRARRPPATRVQIEPRRDQAHAVEAPRAVREGRKPRFESFDGFVREPDEQDEARVQVEREWPPVRWEPAAPARERSRARIHFHAEQDADECDDCFFSRMQVSQAKRGFAVKQTAGSLAQAATAAEHRAQGCPGKLAD